MNYLKKNLTYKQDELGIWTAEYEGFEIVQSSSHRKADCEALGKKWVELMNSKEEPEDDPEATEVVEAVAEETTDTAEAGTVDEEPYNLTHKLSETMEALQNGEELLIMTADILFVCRMTDSGMFRITEKASGETKVVKFPKFFGIAIRDAFGLPTNKKHVRK